MLKRQPTNRSGLWSALMRRISLAVVVVVVAVGILHVPTPHDAGAAVLPGYEIIVQDAAGSGDPCDQGSPHKSSGTHCVAAAGCHFFAIIESPVDLMPRVSSAMTLNPIALYRDNDHLRLFRPPRLPHQA